MYFKIQTKITFSGTIFVSQSDATVQDVRPFAALPLPEAQDAALRL